MKEPLDEKTSEKVFVVSANTLQNELIVSALEKQTGLPCVAVADLARVKHSLDGAQGIKGLVLYDCLAKAGKGCLAEVEQSELGQGFLLALFNLDRGECLEKDALLCGVRGFFYRGEPFSNLVKGVVGMFEGECWISRQVLSQWISDRSMPSGGMEQRLLSRPEKEILRFMVGGATNKEIAEAMFISRHTVKNHLQKIFKKIDVHSKTQAALWASRHFQISCLFRRGEEKNKVKISPDDRFHLP